MITLDEDSRRMQDVFKMYGMSDPAIFGDDGETLVLNANNKLVKYVTDNEETDDTGLICEQLYDLARLTYKPLPADALNDFIARSSRILERVIS